MVPHKEKNLTCLTKFPGISLGTFAAPIHAVPLAMAVWHLTLVVSKLALLALESGVTDALPSHIGTMARAQYRA